MVQIFRTCSGAQPSTPTRFFAARNRVNYRSSSRRSLNLSSISQPRSCCYVRRRAPEVAGECLEVLDDGGEVELVASAGKAPQPHTLKTVVRLQVRKAHHDLLALVAGFDELRCTHQGARCIPCVLMHVARDLSKGHIRSALGLERTWTAVAGARAIKDGPTIVHRPGRPEKLTLRADVEVTLPIEGKVGTRQDALFSLAHVPNRDVRCERDAEPAGPSAPAS